MKKTFYAAAFTMALALPVAANAAEPILTKKTSPVVSSPAASRWSIIICSVVLSNPAASPRCKATSDILNRSVRSA